MTYNVSMGTLNPTIPYHLAVLYVLDHRIIFAFVLNFIFPPVELNFMSL